MATPAIENRMRPNGINKFEVVGIGQAKPHSKLIHHPRVLRNQNIRHVHNIPARFLRSNELQRRILSRLTSPYSPRSALSNLARLDRSGFRRRIVAKIIQQIRDGGGSPSLPRNHLLSVQQKFLDINRAVGTIHTIGNARPEDSILNARTRDEGVGHGPLSHERATKEWSAEPARSPT